MFNAVFNGDLTDAGRLALPFILATMDANCIGFDKAVEACRKGMSPRYMRHLEGALVELRGHPSVALREELWGFR